jgi:hypothetical protein
MMIESRHASAEKFLLFVGELAAALESYGGVTSHNGETVEAAAFGLAVRFLTRDWMKERGGAEEAEEIANDLPPNLLQQIEENLKKGRVEGRRFCEEHSNNLAILYERAVPQALRRQLGQFWTPEPLARLMVRWAVRSPTDVVLDPAAGPGVFLLEAVDRLTGMQVRPEDLASRILGYEIAPTTRLLGALALHQKQESLGERILLGDYLLTRPAFRPTAIVCNPPYTRHHALPEEYKGLVRHNLERRFRVRLSRYSSLFVYFFLCSLEQLEPDGRMAYLTPVELFEASYSHAVIRVLRRQARLRAILRFHPSLEVFPGVDAAPCVSLVEGPGRQASDTFRLLEIKDWEDTQDILNVIEDPGRVGCFPWGRADSVPIADLEPGIKGAVRFDRQAKRAGWVPLIEVAKCVRGIATGGNDFFLLTEEEAKRLELEQGALKPVITKTRDVMGYVLTHERMEELELKGARTRLLCILPEHDISRWPKVCAYLERGREMGIPGGVLVKTRKEWYHSERRATPPILYTYLGRTRPRFIWNAAKVQALTTFLLIYPKESIVCNEINLKALLAVLNSPQVIAGLRDHGRGYGWEAVKIEPREIEGVPIPDFLQITPRDRQRLATLFDDLAKAPHEAEASEKDRLRMLIDEITAALVPREHRTVPEQMDMWV